VLAALALWQRARAPARWRAELAALEDEVGKLTTLVRKLNQRAAMRERREEEPAADAELPAASGDTAQRPGETDIDWKRRMRAQIVRGNLKHKV
jgi:hypothetical protein